MANESPKKPIRRAAVPSVSKEKPAKIKQEATESRKEQNLLLFVLFIFVSGIVYLAIFQKKLFPGYLSSKPSTNAAAAPSDTSSVKEDSTSLNNISTILGDRKDNNENNLTIIYPEGSKFYLIAGTFIFYPYAEKFRDKMNAEGYNASIISTGENRKFHRIYIESSEDISVMRAKRDELRTSKGMDVWIYAE